MNTARDMRVGQAYLIDFVEFPWVRIWAVGAGVGLKAVALARVPLPLPPPPPTPLSLLPLPLLYSYRFFLNSFTRFLKKGALASAPPNKISLSPP